MYMACNVLYHLHDILDNSTLKMGWTLGTIITDELFMSSDRH